MVDPALAKKASSARDKLRALKGGGPAPAPAAETPKPVEPIAKTSDDTLQALAAEASPASVAEPAPTPPPPPPPPAAETPAPAPAPSSAPATRSLPRLPKPGGKENDLPPGTPGSTNTLAAPELAKKASSAMDRLKALKSGAPPQPKPTAQPERGPEGASTTPAHPERGPAGPESKDAAPAGTPGSKNEVAAPEVAKKASSAMERLKALKGGGAAPKADGAPGPLPDKISKGPEAPGEAADPALSKKASSARDRLKAMRGGGGVSAAGAGSGSPTTTAGEAANETPTSGGTATAEAPGSEATA
jgi:Wiskott-Aldrich syndrome protein